MVAFTTFVQEATAMKRLLLGIIAGVALSACGDPEAVEITPWDVGENYTLAYKKGIYKSTLEIIEDTCTPSLKSIVDGAELWPPPYSMMPNGYGGPRSFEFRPYNIRSGGQGVLLGLPTKFGKVRRDDPYKVNLPSENNGFGNPFESYCKNLDGRDYSSVMTLRARAEDRAEVEIEDEWFGFVSCDYEEARRRHAWFPKEPCRERYKIIYTLVEELAKDCRDPYLGDTSVKRPINPQNPAPYPEAAYYPYYDRDDIVISCGSF
jgi:hypothetical protein